MNLKKLSIPAKYDQWFFQIKKSSYDNKNVCRWIFTRYQHVLYQREVESCWLTTTIIFLVHRRQFFCYLYTVTKPTLTPCELKWVDTISFLFGTQYLSWKLNSSNKYAYVLFENPTTSTSSFISSWQKRIYQLVMYQKILSIR